jgi:hypothetical protein
MKTRFVSLALVGVLVAAGLSAQTKASGKCTCKADPASPPAVALTDKPNHSFAVGKALCTWTNWVMAGVQAKDGTSTDLDEINGDTISVGGYHVATMTNGDTWVAKYEGSGKLKDGKPVSGEGTWTLTSGTGKLKGIQGKGTYKGTANADGSVTYQVDGEYQLP